MLALIASVGGSPEPIIKSIEESAPQFVCFYASEESIDQVAGIKQSLASKGLSWHDRKVIVANAQDLIDCYETGIKAGALTEAEGYKADEIVVDITGGTKTMSVGLALATVARGYRYSYVGGLQRSKDGLGIVVSGTEMVRQTVNPWDLLAVRDRERLEWAFNAFHYDVALDLVRDLKVRTTLSPRWQALFDGLEPLAKAYMHWDRFEHKEIGDLITRGVDKLKLCQQAAEWEALSPFIEEVLKNRRFYDEFRNASHGFRSDRLCEWHFADLVGNAKRRMSEGKYDDATARLYRALEMKAQKASMTTQQPGFTALWK